LSFGFHLAGKCPDKPQLAGGVEGHNTNDISLPGSVAFGAESFKFELCHLTFSPNGVCFWLRYSDLGFLDCIPIQIVVT
jgi:hypothetical protein